MQKESDDQYSDREIAERMAKALRRSLETPPKRQKPLRPKKRQKPTSAK